MKLLDAPLDQGRLAFAQSLKVRETIDESKALLRELSEKDKELGNLKEVYKLAEANRDLRAQELYLAVEGKNEWERKSRHVQALAADQVWQSNDVEMRATRAQMVMVEADRDRLARHFSLNLKILEERSALLWFLGGQQQ